MHSALFRERALCEVMPLHVVQSISLLFLGLAILDDIVRLVRKICARKDARYDASPIRW
jgi:hypothetical protein